MTTIDTVTYEQIIALRDEAGSAGDREMYRLAAVAADQWCFKVEPSRAATRAAEACVKAIRDAEGRS